jgi:hypothetical protein
MFLNDSEWRDVEDADDLFKRLQVKARSGADRDFLSRRFSFPAQEGLL